MKITTDKEQFDRVRTLCMDILEGHGTRNMVDELKNFSRDHHPHCAMGSVPACTCGLCEARNLIGLLDGTLKGVHLVN